MPSSFMMGLHNSPPVVSENLNTVHPQVYYPGPSVSGVNPQQTLNNASLVALRQLMEDSNHEMVNMLTQQIGTVFNPLIRDTHNSYLTLSDQMWRIVVSWALLQGEMCKYLKFRIIGLLKCMSIGLMLEILSIQCPNLCSNHHCQGCRKEIQFWFKGTKILIK